MINVLVHVKYHGPTLTCHGVVVFDESSSSPEETLVCLYEVTVGNLLGFKLMT